MDKYRRQQIIKAAESDINFFAGLCLPEVMTLDFPAEYEAISEILMEDAKAKNVDDHNYALGFPRGLAKTTWAKIISAWLFCYTDKQYTLVGCSTEPKAQSFIADVYGILNSPNLTQLFGSPQSESKKDTQTLKIFKYRGKTRILHAVGAKGDPRGVNIDFRRPDVHICDDLQSRENAKSPAESKALMEWYSSTFYYTKSHSGLLHIYIGNTFPYEGCILTHLRRNEFYTSFVVGAILANGEALWPELVSKEKILKDLKRAISIGQVETFLSEIMNDDKSLVALGFDYSKIPQWDKDPSYAPMSGYIMIDPAGDKKDSDDTAIGAAFIYDDISKPYFREVIADKFSPLETIKQAIKMALRHNIRAVFIESVAYQSSLAFWFKYVMDQVGIQGINAIPITPRPAPKNVRIMDSLRSIQTGDIVLHDEVSSIVQNQIATFDPSITNNKDDILDLLDYFKEIPQRFPTEISLLIDPLYYQSEESRILPAWENSPF